MRYEIILSPEAIADLRRLSARDRAIVRDALDTHLRFDPTTETKSRVKRLRGLSRPQFRLRVGDIRVYFEVRANQVEILGIVPKSAAQSWLAEWEKESL
jgi:mRNA interferase RelE/StbE